MARTNAVPTCYSACGVGWTDTTAEVAAVADRDGGLGGLSCANGLAQAASQGGAGNSPGGTADPAYLSPFGVGGNRQSAPAGGLVVLSWTPATATRSPSPTKTRVRLR